MILTELTELAHREGLADDPDFEPKPVRWIVTIALSGGLLGVSETNSLPDSRGKTRPKELSIPRTPPRANNPPPAFLVDNAEFTLGYDPSGVREAAVLQARNQAFRAYIKRVLDLAPGEEGLEAVVAFLASDDQRTACLTAIKSRLLKEDRIAFRCEIDGPLVHDRPLVRDAWQRMRGASASGQSDCLACGKSGSPIRLHPQIGRIPGAPKPVPFVSFNKDAFNSYGFVGNENAAICQTCADAYGTALNRLFHPEYPGPDGTPLRRRSIRFSEDTGVIYWASAKSDLEDEFGAIDVNPEELQPLLDSMHRGTPSTVGDLDRFSALIVTGAQGRATIRGYIQLTITELATNIRRYFADIEMVARFANAPKYPALKWLIRSTAAQGKDKNVTPDLAGRLFLAIVRGDSLPTSVLSAVIGRIRAERDDPSQGQSHVKHTRERLALIRMTLNRWFDDKDPRITPLIPQRITDVLDESCPNNAYCLGRLFAVLEKLQGEAIGKINASIADRFYGAASATPAAVFATLLRKAQAHLRKMSGSFYDQKIQAVMQLLNPTDAFPTSLSLPEQGLFALGYYHQRADLWKGKDPKVEAPDSPPA